MDDDTDLRHFSNVCRLFPLPNVVLFPHAVLPLHVFEPRYREMTADALADDRLVTIVQLRSSTPVGADPLGSPPIEEVGCLGRILQHTRLPDGRYNFLLLGRKRVRLHRDIPCKHLYRIAEGAILQDVPEEGASGTCADELIGLFRSALAKDCEIGPDLEGLLENPLPLGVLTDIVAHALALPAALKQGLLAETRVARRAEVLTAVLRQGSGRGGDPRSFPPHFSPN